jgi:TM2 domain-containing membrane protein YozV
MIDPELLAKLEEISEKADKAYVAAEKVRTYLFWTGIVTIVLFVLPLIGLVFAVPNAIDSYTKTLNDVGY